MHDHDDPVGPGRQRQIGVILAILGGLFYLSGLLAHIISMLHSLGWL